MSGTEQKGWKHNDIRCVALDLDRTTLNAEGKLSLGNRAALVALLGKGIQVVIASGRAFESLPKDVLELKGIRYAITSNGAAVYSVPEGKCLHQYKIEETAVRHILALLEEEPVSLEAFIGGKAYAPFSYMEDPVRFGATEQAVDYIRRTRNGVADIRAFILEHADCLDSMDVVVAKEALKRRLWEKIKEEEPRVYVTSSVRQLLELSDYRAGKHSGLRFVLAELGLEPEQAAAFGDADNDVDMLKLAGTGIAMENGSEAAKRQADYITRHHDADGVAYALHEILHLI